MTGWLASYLDHPATYLKWGWFQISISNLIVILVMLALFAAAILIKFPKGRE